MDILQKLKNILDNCVEKLLNCQLSNEIMVDFQKLAAKEIKLEDSEPSNNRQIFEHMSAIINKYDEIKQYHHLLVEIPMNKIDEFCKTDVLLQISIMETKYNKIKIAMEQFIKEQSDKYISRIIQNLINEIKSYELLQSYWREFGCTHIYAGVMQRSIDYNLRDNKALAEQILDLIEQDKSYAITIDNSRKNNKRSKLKPNKTALPFLQGFSLIPITPYYTKKELLKVRSIHSAGKNIFNSLSDKNTGVIVKKNISKSVIAFDIHRLNDPEYKTSPHLGINTKLIDKLTTQDKIGECSVPQWEYEIYNSDALQFIIIEVISSMNSKTDKQAIYRAVAPYKSQIWEISRFKIKHFIQHVSDQMKISKVSGGLKVHRTEAYHKLQTHKITKNIFLPKPMEIKKLQDYSRLQIEPAFIRQKIKIATMALFSKYVKPTAKPEVQRTKLINLVQSEEIGHTFSASVISQLTNIESKTNYKGKKQSLEQTEALCSYFAELVKITRIYKRELFDRTIISIKNSNISGSSLNSLFEKKITETLETIIRNKSNLFQNYLFKFNLIQQAKKHTSKNHISY